jgi:hypothetical protein
MFCLSPFAFPSISVPSGGGGGISLGNVSLRTIDPTSWSTNDPDSLLKDVSHASGTGLTTFTFNALATGSAVYTLGSSTQNFPRRYTDLQADNGDGTYTTLTTDDNLMIYLRVSSYSTDFASRLFVAVAVDPTSTTASTQQGYGVFLYKPSGNPGDGLWDVSSTLQNLNSATDSANGILNYSLERSVGLTSFSLRSTDILLNLRQRTLTDTLPASTDLKIMVGVATNASSTTITEDQTVAGKLEYQAFKLSI